MKFSLAAFSVALSIAVAVASPPRDVLDHASKIKDAVIEKRVAGQSFANEQLEKRASQYLNDKSKSISTDLSSLNMLWLNRSRVCC